MKRSRSRVMPVDLKRRLSLARLLDPEVEFVVVTELPDGSLLVTPSVLAETGVD